MESMVLGQPPCDIIASFLCDTIPRDSAIREDSNSIWKANLFNLVPRKQTDLQIMAIQKRSKALNISVWVVQILLSLTFLYAGFMKLFLPEDLPWLWIQENTELVWISGVVDMLAGLGLTLPSLLRILPKLTVYAAFGSMVLMLSAILFHVLRGEGDQIGFNVFIFICAAFVVWGRGKKYPIELANRPFK
tara:strand:+ start:2148 stop:2717 length:570 start_codon:yes stop_codon:yes gene_type:complete